MTHTPDWIDHAAAEMRLRCLELAKTIAVTVDGVEEDDQVLARAQRYADFVFGSSDA